MRENKIKSLQKREEGCGWYVLFALLVAALFLTRIWWVNSYGGVIVSGNSMQETLQSGDYLLMKKTYHGQGLERGDVIVVDVTAYPECGNTDYLIKRLIAVEGDKVKCENEQLYICYAGSDEYVMLDEPYAYYGLKNATYDFQGQEYVVGEGEIFFLGDNRENSMDSRYKEIGGSHLKGRLYKADDVYGVVPEWSVKNKKILGAIQGFKMKLANIFGKNNKK